MSEIDSLAESHQVRGEHELEHLHGLLSLPRGDEPQGINVLVVLLRALDVSGDRAGQVQQLGTVGRHGNLRALESVVEAGVGPSAQVRGQAAVVEVVHQFGELGEGQLPDGREREAQIVHGHADGRPLEVASVHGHVPRHIDERVVVDGVDFPLDCVRGLADHLDLRPEPLRGRPQRVPVLLRLLQWIGLVQLLSRLHVGAPIQHPVHDGRGLDLARVVLELVREEVGEFRLAVHGLAEERGRDLGQHGQHVGVVAHGGRQARAHGGTVH
ncbi:hypothetical protein Mapa_010069 [Marchantia paleacea]|nr:hypothetical protein Mapa_010069 [Marchantia paleacea]